MPSEMLSAAYAMHTCTEVWWSAGHMSVRFQAVIPSLGRSAEGSNCVGQILQDNRSKLPIEPVALHASDPDVLRGVGAMTLSHSTAKPPKITFGIARQD